MRAVALYLVIYFALVAGALIALWQGGVLVFLSTSWIVLGLLVAVGLGVLLALVTAWHPRVPQR